FDVGGIGVSGQQHGLVCLDRGDRPARAAKLWNDTTTAPQCAELTRTLGGDGRVLELTGNLILPGYTAPKIAWVATHEPDAYARTVRICLPHDYLNLWLTGEFVTESGDASGTAYFDVRARRYSDAVLAAMDDRRDWTRTLPPVVASLSVVGRLRAEAADSLGREAGTPVSAGGAERRCAARGAAVAGGGAAGLAFLPYLSGERTPTRPDGTGVFVGLRASQGRDAIVYAVVEGVTFGLAYALDALRRTGVAPTEVTLIGGGSASDAWAQLCADIFGLPVVRPTIVEAAASGAARQAQWALEAKRPRLAPAQPRRFDPR